MTKEEKQAIDGRLKEQFEAQMLEVYRVEERLGIYYEGLVREPEMHNAYEMLGALKFLRLLRTYEQDIETFRDVVFKYEGIWEQREGLWRHVEGGLKHPGTTGPTYYRLQPFQVFVLASMFLLKAWVNTEAEEGSRELLPTEEVKRPTPSPSRQGGGELAQWGRTALKSAGTPAQGVGAGAREEESAGTAVQEESAGDAVQEESAGDAERGEGAMERKGATESRRTEQPGMERGMIYDLRRLCTEFTFYTPRKTAKTQLSAFIQFWYFMSGDENAECYCCANASDQAKILFSRTRELIHQMDPRERRIRFTASQVNWKPGQFRTASLTALSAGGKTKDGLFAQLCSADEYGSAAYVNGASDMGKLVSVVESSMGPRREPMTFISTTAGINTTGPFVDKLQGIRRLLEKEMDPDAERSISDDRQACLLLEPDEWEQQDEELLLTSKEVRRKVNPMLGIIVQHSFYDDEIAKARQNPEKMNEVVCKLLNVYKGAKVTAWIKSDRIRPLQIERRIEDCTFADGWQVFTGLDFSQGDDLFAVTYLAVDYKPSDTMRGRFFADCDLWVLEETMKQSPNRPLYEAWVEQGWLHVCPGEVFDSMHAINRIAAVVQAGVNIVSFGYDAAQSVQPINQLKAWLQTLFQQRGDISPKDMAEVLQRMVVPVSQTAMAQNPRIGELEHMILEKEPWLTFSANPMWPWMFGNCAAELNSSDLRRIVKGGPQPTHKIDGVAALEDALYLFDLSEGRIEQ